MMFGSCCTHLFKGPTHIHKFINDVGRHQDHGGQCYSPANAVCPQREGVVIVGQRLEIYYADYHHKLEKKV